MSIGRRGLGVYFINYYGSELSFSINSLKGSCMRVVVLVTWEGGRARGDEKARRRLMCGFLAVLDAG